MFHLGFLEGLPKYDKKENNMEWKELEIDNLPPDILTGNYEFQMRSRVAKCDLPNTYYDYKNYSSVVDILEKLNMGYYSFRYRKPEPKQPTALQAMENMKAIIETFFQSCPESEK